MKSVDGNIVLKIKSRCLFSCSIFLRRQVLPVGDQCDLGMVLGSFECSQVARD